MYAIQARFGLGDPAWLDPAIAAGIFVVSLLLALVFAKLLCPVILRVTQLTPTDLDSRLVTSMRMPVTLGIVVLGAYLAFVIPLDLSDGERKAVETVGAVLAILAGIVAIASLASTAFDWYLENAASGSRTALAVRLIPLLRRVSSLLIYGLGGLLILDQLNVTISPLIAALGLGGLAVALALQPTLANLFAGGYVMSEGIISSGDYIELEGGIAGYVLEVGWRSTRIRTWSNNLVVIPNSRFAETIVTNYQEPYPMVNVYVTCGTSYDSDLYQVEQVCREVMEELIESSPDAVKEYGAYFGFDGFGDSNVDFWLFIQARDRLASFKLRSSLIQMVHQRFKEENIVINYPVRTLQLPAEWSPDQVRAQVGGGETQDAEGTRRRGRPDPGRRIRGGVEGESGGEDGPDI